MTARPVIPVILCGGSGARLWPLSRREHPKQFLKLLGERSPFQETVARARSLAASGPVLLVANAAHRGLLSEELAGIGGGDIEILLEPAGMGRNTAPALAAAALHAGRTQPGALLLALPADHFVEDAERLVAAVGRGIGAAAQGALVAFGVSPTHAHTGYGYIRRAADTLAAGVWRVRAFVEKPDVDAAKAYVASGDYLWNSGMLLTRADVYIRELRRHAPDIAAAAEAAVQGIERDGVLLRLEPLAFSACRSDSIDYAVLEHTGRVAVVELDTGWSDLGSWSSLLQAGMDGSGNNAVQGDVLLADVQGSIVHSSGRLVAAVGLRDQVVVETADAVLVAPLERAEEVKHLVASLQSGGRREAQGHVRVHQDWGWRECLLRDAGVEVSRVQINPHADLPLPGHPQSALHLSVLHGEAEVTLEHKTIAIRAGESASVPVGGRQCLRNTCETPLLLVEVRSEKRAGVVT